jgi:hypothetical protein
MMNKRLLVEKIIAHLDEEMARYAKAARSAQAEATDEQSRAENKYDTRGLEASYLAHGQSRQAMETEQARQQFATLILRDFGPQEPIGLGALIELERNGERSFYFLGPSAGGTEVLHEDQEVLVLTAQSPLGRQLLGKRQGERLPTAPGGMPGDGFQVVAVV